MSSASAFSIVSGSYWLSRQARLDRGAQDSKSRAPRNHSGSARARTHRAEPGTPRIFCAPDDGAVRPLLLHALGAVPRMLLCDCMCRACAGVVVLRGTQTCGGGRGSTTAHRARLFTASTPGISHVTLYLSATPANPRNGRQLPHCCGCPWTFSSSSCPVHLACGVTPNQLSVVRKGPTGATDHPRSQCSCKRPTRRLTG